MDCFDKDYKQKERNLIIYHYTKLLSELLLLNYKFSNHEYSGTCGIDVFSILHKKIKLTEQEKQEIVSNASLLLKIKYRKNLIDFERIEFE